MEATMINNVLLGNWSPTFKDFGFTLAFLANTDAKWYDHNPYFFLKRELGVTAQTWNDEKKKGTIRHCKVYRGRFLDYIVNKEFDTLADWVKDAGGTLDDVLYGVNRIHKNMWIYDKTTQEKIIVPQPTRYVELSVLLKALKYVPPPKVEIPATATQDLSDMINLELRMHGLTIDNVWIIQNNIPTRWSEFMTK